MQRLEILREHLKDTAPAIWEEPFHEAWIAGDGLDARVRFATAQAPEMGAARPFVKPGELVIGNNALRPSVTGLPTPFRSGIYVDRAYLQTLREEHPEARSRLAEIEAYWTRWMEENGQYASDDLSRVAGVRADPDDGGGGHACVCGALAFCACGLAAGVRTMVRRVADCARRDLGLYRCPCGGRCGGGRDVSRVRQR